MHTICRFCNRAYALDLPCPETGVHGRGSRSLPCGAVLGGLAPTTSNLMVFAIMTIFCNFGPSVKFSDITPRTTSLLSGNMLSDSRVISSIAIPASIPSFCQLCKLQGLSADISRTYRAARRAFPARRTTAVVIGTTSLHRHHLILARSPPFVMPA